MAMKATRPDAEIERDVKDTIYADLRILSESIDVQVRQGRVYLRGVVPDENQKSLARMVADRIKGVQRVINELEVVPVESRGDADITADVVAALAADSLVDEDKIEVTTVDGIVYLRGTVGTYAERRAVDEDARSIRGVVDVIDEVLVAPSYACSDEEITAEFLEELRRNLKLDHKGVEVEAKHGILYLRGSVETVEQRWLIDELARWTPGVIDVVNELSVSTNHESFCLRRRARHG